MKKKNSPNHRNDEIRSILSILKFKTFKLSINKLDRDRDVYYISVQTI